MKARDVMEPAGECLRLTDTLKEAIRLMCRSGGDGARDLAVEDAEGRLLGVVTKMEVLKAIVPEYLALENLEEFTWDGMLEKMASRVAGKKVSEFIHTGFPAAGPDDPLMECAGLMVHYNVMLVPVVDAERKVLGLVYARDICKAVAGNLSG